MFKIAIILGSTRSQANGRALFNHLPITDSFSDSLPIFRFGQLSTSLFR